MDAILDEALSAGIAALDKIGLRYAIVGGLARPRDFDDLVTLCSHLGSRLDDAHIDSWARKLDASLGTSEVSERISQARLRAGRRD